MQLVSDRFFQEFLQVLNPLLFQDVYQHTQLLLAFAQRVSLAGHLLSLGFPGERLRLGAPQEHKGSAADQQRKENRPTDAAAQGSLEGGGRLPIKRDTGDQQENERAAGG